MGRRKDYSKYYIEDYPKTLSISFLKRHGYLDIKQGIKSGNLTWSRNGEDIGNIGIEVISEETQTSSEKLGQILTSSDNFRQVKTLRVFFTQTSRDTEEKKRFDYRIQLVSTQCNYGGVRYWFTCPCGGNRCAKLYLQGNGYFASRKTLGLGYESQNESKRWRYFDKHIAQDRKAEKVYRDIKYPYRNGKPTRKFRKYLKLMRYDIPLELQEKALIDIFLL